MAMTEQEKMAKCSEIALSIGRANLGELEKAIQEAGFDPADQSTAIITVALNVAQLLILQTSKAMAAGIGGQMQMVEHRRLFVSACNQIRAAGVAVNFRGIIAVPINLESPDG